MTISTFAAASISWMVFFFILAIATAIGGLLASWPAWLVWIFVEDKKGRAKELSQIIGGVLVAVGCIFGFGTFINAMYKIDENDTGTQRILADLKTGMLFHYRPSPPPIPTEIGKTEIKPFKLLSITPPKHMYVVLEDMASHEEYQSIYVGKHCSGYKDNPLGATFNLSVSHMKNGEKTWLQFNGLYEAFCK